MAAFMLVFVLRETSQQNNNTVAPEALNKVTNVQECDATDDHKRYIARLKKMYFSLPFICLNNY